MPKMSLLSDFWLFLRTRKRWWISPIIIILLLMALMVVLFEGPLAPFIYTLF